MEKKKDERGSRCFPISSLGKEIREALASRYKVKEKGYSVLTLLALAATQNRYGH